MGPFVLSPAFEGWNLEKQSKKSLEEYEINRDIVCCHMYHETLFRAVISHKVILRISARSIILPSRFFFSYISFSHRCDNAEI